MQVQHFARNWWRDTGLAEPGQQQGLADYDGKAGFLELGGSALDSATASVEHLADFIWGVTLDLQTCRTGATVLGLRTLGDLAVARTRRIEGLCWTCATGSWWT